MKLNIGLKSISTIHAVLDSTFRSLNENNFSINDSNFSFNGIFFFGEGFISCSEKSYYRKYSNTLTKTIAM